MLFVHVGAFLCPRSCIQVYALLVRVPAFRFVQVYVLMCPRRCVFMLQYLHSGLYFLFHVVSFRFMGFCSALVLSRTGFSVPRWYIQMYASVCPHRCIQVCILNCLRWCAFMSTCCLQVHVFGSTLLHSGLCFRFHVGTFRFLLLLVHVVAFRFAFLFVPVGAILSSRHCIQAYVFVSPT